MRYDTPVYIRYTAQPNFNPQTGNYDEPEPIEEKAYVDLQGAETDLKTQELGGVTEEEITITFQRPPKRPFSAIRYGEKLFWIESAIYPRNATTFIMKEVK